LKPLGKPAATVAALALVLGFSLAGCGDDGGDDGGDDSGPKTIDVTFKGDTVTPNGDRVEVEHGDDVTLDVTADKAGEIHVHSDPEQELEYDAGTTTLTIKNLDRPGVVEVESHSLDKVIVQLEVK
jgi:hypothetical protein